MKLFFYPIKKMQKLHFILSVELHKKNSFQIIILTNSVKITCETVNINNGN